MNTLQSKNPRILIVAPLRHAAFWRCCARFRCRARSAHRDGYRRRHQVRPGCNRSASPGVPSPRRCGAGSPGSSGTRRLPRLEDLVRDLLYGVRTLSRQKAATAVVALTLAIGIGASTAIFSAIKPILIDPLPYPHASRLMMLWETGKSGTPSPVTFGTFQGLNQRNRSFDSLAVFKAWQPASAPTSQADRPERLDGQRVSADYFRTLGISPFRGRDFQASDDRLRGPNVVILSDKVWRVRFASDAAIVGKQIRLDDALYTVIGVMPANLKTS